MSRFGSSKARPSESEATKTKTRLCIFEDNISLVIDFLYALYLIMLHLYHSMCSIESGFLFTSILLLD